MPNSKARKPARISARAAGAILRHPLRYLSLRRRISKSKGIRGPIRIRPFRGIISRRR
jgi:hypothetical protein